MTNISTIDSQEITKFAQHASSWWDKQGPLKTLHDINPARLAFVEKQIALVNKTVLDVGCGGGIFTEAMAKKGALVTGLDVEVEAIAAAKAHAVKNKLKIDYICCPLEDFDAEQFDLISCMEMLEHVKNPQHVIHHCVRLLKPGGYLFLSTINRTAKAYTMAILAAEYLLGLLPKQTHDYTKFIKPSELRMITKQEGLSFYDLEGMTYNPLTREAKLTASPDVNYLMACYKPK